MWSLPDALRGFAEGPDPESPIAGLIRAKRHGGLIAIDSMAIGFVVFGIVDAPWWLTGRDPVAPAVVIAVLAGLTRSVFLFRRHQPWADRPS